MSSCSITVRFDEATVEAGQEISGTVIVNVDADVDAKSLMIEQVWRTHGRGNEDLQHLNEKVEETPRWTAGKSYEYPFRFPVPDCPVSYHGHLINVDHYVRAQADLPWKTDPKGEADYLVVPGAACAQGYIKRAIKKETQQKASGCGKVLGFLLLPVIIPLLLVLLAILLPIVLIAGTVMLMRRYLAERRLGKVTAEIGAPLVDSLKPDEYHGPGAGLVHRFKGIKGGTYAVGPGQALPVTLSLTPPADTTINGARLEIEGKEQAVSGSGTRATTHRHSIFSETVTLIEAGTLAGGQPVDVSVEVPLPETDAFSLEASSNKILWKAKITIDIPGWPDWVRELDLLMIPAR